MKQKLSCAAGVIVVVLFALGGTPIKAQTVANGPYYALPSWDQKLPSSSRFIVLANWNSEAVLDRETGLVWERSPSTSPLPWVNGQNRCNTLNTGDRMGWRLPALQELASLVDRTQPNPTLPSGHPFQNVQSSFYWSATTLFNSFEGNIAWHVNFSGGFVAGSIKTLTNFVWCVRGGQGVDPQ